MDGDDAVKNASEIVFTDIPTMLCIWHVNQRISAYYKGLLGNDWLPFYALWQGILYAQTIDKYEERWLQLQAKYSTGGAQKCVDYIRKEWLKEGQRKRLVAAWTSYYMHFGTQTTSR